MPLGNDLVLALRTEANFDFGFDRCGLIFRELLQNPQEVGLRACCRGPRLLRTIQERRTGHFATDNTTRTATQ